jgi:hypothetical protein
MRMDSTNLSTAANARWPATHASELCGVNASNEISLTLNSVNLTTTGWPPAFWAYCIECRPMTLPSVSMTKAM